MKVNMQTKAKKKKEKENPQKEPRVATVMKNGPNKDKKRKKKDVKKKKTCAARSDSLEAKGEARTKNKGVCRSLRSVANSERFKRVRARHESTGLHFFFFLLTTPFVLLSLIHITQQWSPWHACHRSDPACSLPCP